jgi:hypothetical protein
VPPCSMPGVANSTHGPARGGRAGARRWAGGRGRTASSASAGAGPVRHAARPRWSRTRLVDQAALPLLGVAERKGLVPVQALRQVRVRPGDEQRVELVGASRHGRAEVDGHLAGRVGGAWWRWWAGRGGGGGAGGHQGGRGGRGRRRTHSGLSEAGRRRAPPQQRRAADAPPRRLCPLPHQPLGAPAAPRAASAPRV